jgi:hypothetical protein
MGSRRFEIPTFQLVFDKIAGSDFEQRRRRWPQTGGGQDSAPFISRNRPPIPRNVHVSMARGLFNPLSKSTRYALHLT